AAFRNPYIDTAQLWTQRIPIPSLSPNSQAQSSPPTVADLRENKSLWYKLHVYIYELQHSRSNENSRGRLELLIDPLYLGEPCFSDAEREINPLPSQRSLGLTNERPRTLRSILDYFSSRLEKRVEGRVKETKDWRVCAAHDLAPAFEEILGVKAKDRKINKEFTSLVKRKRLKAMEEGEAWKGAWRKK
ncbi:hypothetical protein P154DRAFT_443362, partial [Amniculicola lignicola CBS 123094]